MSDQTQRNIYHYDVKNVYCVPGKRNLDGTITYDEEKIFQEPGIRSIDMQAQGDVNKVRADGIDYIVYSSNNGYSGSANFVMISDEFRKRLLAEKVDDTSGIQYEDVDAELVPFAIMGEFKGDKRGIRWIFYNVTASRPNIAGDNKDDQKQPDEESVNLTASPVPITLGTEEVNIVRGGITKVMNENTYNKWFEKVCIPGVSYE